MDFPPPEQPRTIAVRSASSSENSTPDVLHSFPRGYRGELREPVEHLRLFFLEVAQGIVIRDFGRVGESQHTGRDQGQRTNGALAGGEAGPQIGVGLTERGNRADAGDRDATRHFWRSTPL